MVNHDALREHERQRYSVDKAFRERVLKRAKEWRKNNPAKKDWPSRSPEKRREQRKKSYKFQTPEQKLRKILGTRLSDALKGKIKVGHTKELVGIPLPELRVYLEKQFRPGMSWGNYGAIWHVDHVRPCASFDFSNSEHQKQCFHYTNLQPLFATENFKKGARWSGG